MAGGRGRHEGGRHEGHVAGPSRLAIDLQGNFSLARMKIARPPFESSAIFPLIALQSYDVDLSPFPEMHTHRNTKGFDSFSFLFFLLLPFSLSVSVYALKPFPHVEKLLTQ